MEFLKNFKIFMGSVFSGFCIKISVFFSALSVSSVAESVLSCRRDHISVHVQSGTSGGTDPGKRGPY